MICTTKDWEINEIFSLYKDNIKVNVVEPKEKPEGLEFLINANWNMILEERITKQNSPREEFRFEPYKKYNKKTEYNSLYHKENLLIWPGFVSRLENYNYTALKMFKKSELTLDVSQITFPEVLAVKNPAYFYYFKDNKVPSAPLAVDVLVISSDDYITLSKRGNNTPFYPGAYHVFGGNIELAGTHPVEEMSRELFEELGILEEEHFDIDSIEVNALSNDKLFMWRQDKWENPKTWKVRKPELHARIRVNLSKDEINKIFNDKKKKELDAQSIHFIKYNENSLRETIKKFNLTRPCEVSLFLELSKITNIKPEELLSEIY